MDDSNFYNALEKKYGIDTAAKLNAEYTRLANDYYTAENKLIREMIGTYGDHKVNSIVRSGIRRSMDHRYK